MTEPSFTVCHGTYTGRANQTLKSFLEQGIKPPAPGRVETSHQRNGFFVSSEIHEHKEFLLHRETNEDGSFFDGEEVEQYEGDPMVVFLRCDLNADWTLDYEWEDPIAGEILEKFKDELSEMPQQTITNPQNAQTVTIERFTALSPEQGDGFEIACVIGSLKIPQTFSMPWNGDKLTPASASTFHKKSPISPTRLHEVLRDYLHETYGERFYRVERETIRAALAQDRELHLKYSGDAPLKISHIEVHNGDEWHSVPLPHPEGAEQEPDAAVPDAQPE